MANRRLKNIVFPWDSSNTYQPDCVADTTSDSKSYLLGHTSIGSFDPATTNTNVYATAGTVSATKYRVGEKVRQEYNSTTESLDFIFE